MKTGVQLITEERQRQVDGEGWSSDHDDGHRRGSMVKAAICYAAKAIGLDVRERVQMTRGESFLDPWPWALRFDKRQKHSLIHCLVVAGALIAAEIDRQQRAGEDVESKGHKALGTSGDPIWTCTECGSNAPAHKCPVRKRKE